MLGKLNNEILNRKTKKLLLAFHPPVTITRASPMLHLSTFNGNNDNCNENQKDRDNDNDNQIDSENDDDNHKDSQKDD